MLRQYSCGAPAHCVPPSRLYLQLPILLAEMRLLSAGQWELGPASMPGSTVCTLSIILPWMFHAWRSWSVWHSGAHTRLSRVLVLYLLPSTTPSEAPALLFFQGLKAQNAHLAEEGGRSDDSPLIC